MILVDTSVWIDHLRSGNEMLASLLNDGVVAVHPFIIGELACGNLPNRHAFLRDLRKLPMVQSATNEEALHVLQRHHLYGAGIGWVDVHLIASILLSGSQLFTLDDCLARAAIKANATLFSRVQ
jgi:predicted nucleic acid-binding protein